MRLLIAEDEVDLAEALTVFFEKNHFSVDAVHNGFDAYEYASSGAYDAVILDVMMPKMDGIQVLEKLRQEGVKTPIMMLTAKGQKSDRITGFNAGADDYLPKPFDPDELLSRVRAILRRSEAYQPTVLAYGDLTLDPGSGNLSCGKDPIRLSGREFQIMELFMRSPRQVFSAERIMERVWGWDNEAEINVVWVNISNLRKKLKSIGSHVTLQANRGLGYVLEESAQFFFMIFLCCSFSWWPWGPYWTKCMPSFVVMKPSDAHTCVASPTNTTLQSSNFFPCGRFSTIVQRSPISCVGWL